MRQGTDVVIRPTQIAEETKSSLPKADLWGNSFGTSLHRNTRIPPSPPIVRSSFSFFFLLSCFNPKRSTALCGCSSANTDKQAEYGFWLIRIRTAHLPVIVSILSWPWVAGLALWHVEGLGSPVVVVPSGGTLICLWQSDKLALERKVFLFDLWAHRFQENAKSLWFLFIRAFDCSGGESLWVLTFATQVYMQLSHTVKVLLGSWRVCQWIGER